MILTETKVFKYFRSVTFTVAAAKGPHSEIYRAERGCVVLDQPQQVAWRMLHNFPIKDSG